jgi:PPE-repeat protein
MLDFALLPPEITSALMYSGPGSGPMLAAATAWEGLATELRSVASSYGSLIAGLTDGPWQGPAAAGMAGASAAQIAWLSTAAGQAEQAAAQAAAAAGAFEAAFVETVPPPEVAATRALLTALVAMNFFGQNTAAIVATEAQYAEMWAQDAAAMYGYAGTSASASALTPFNPAVQTANPAGLGAQAAAVAQAVGTAGATSAQTTVPEALAALAGPVPVPPWTGDLAAALGLTGHVWNANGDGLVMGGALGDVLEGLTGSSTLDASTGFDAFIRLISPTRLFTTAFKDVQGLAQGLAPPAAAKAAAGIAEAVPHNLPIPPAPGAATAALSKAELVGRLSVPQAWAAAAPTASPAAASLGGVGTTPAVEPASNTMGGLPVMGTAGGRGANFAAPRYGFKPTVMTQPPSGG